MTSTNSQLTYAVALLRKQLTDRGTAGMIGAAAFLIFVVATFFIKGLHALAIVSLCTGAGLALSSGVAAELVRRAAWFWLFLAFLVAWMLLGAVFRGEGYRFSDLVNPILLGTLLLFTAYTSRILSIRQILWVIAIVGGASACMSLIVHVFTAPHFLSRLNPLGRGGNSIPGAGGLAISIIALATLWLQQGFERRSVPVFAALALPLLLTFGLTQSRAPIIALCLALPFAWMLQRRGSIAILLACLVAWLTIGGLILFEQPLKSLVCQSNLDWCRPSYRTEIWGWVREQIALHPILGTGPSFRFTRTAMTHPHNGLFGVAMYYGIVMLAAFIVMIAIYVGHLARQRHGALRFFGLASLIFSFGYMGADLSNPFAFFNTHYLFMWFPLFLILSAEDLSSQASRPGGLQRA